MKYQSLNGDQVIDWKLLHHNIIQLFDSVNNDEFDVEHERICRLLDERLEVYKLFDSWCYWGNTTSYRHPVPKKLGVNSSGYGVWWQKDYEGMWKGDYGYARSHLMLFILQRCMFEVMKMTVGVQEAAKHFGYDCDGDRVWYKDDNK